MNYGGKTTLSGSVLKNRRRKAPRVSKWRRMALTRPRRRHNTVKQKKRLEFLRINLTAGRRGDIDIADRRARFAIYKQVHLPTIVTQSCYLCSKVPQQWHHIVPLSKGGDDFWTNLVPLCVPCHKKVHRHDVIRGNRKKKIYKSAFTKPTLEVVYVPPEKLAA
jgi:5-methylcytosine-specific restriction endonuclease McrA